MGLIKSNFGTVNSKSIVQYEIIDNDILIKKFLVNTIDTLIVSEGQCAIVIDNGKVVDAALEEGVYTYDLESEPLYTKYSIEFIKEIQNTNKEELDKAVLFINLNEIFDKDFESIEMGYDNKNIKCYGEFSFKIQNPFVLINKLIIDNEYNSNKLLELLEPNIKNVLKESINSSGIAISYLPVNRVEIDEKIGIIKEYGIQICSFDVESITLKD